MPKKVFNYGHTIYNMCIKIFSQKPKSEKYTFIISSCLLYGVPQKISSFQFIPPIASTCVLYIDRGGIRGVIPLTFLNHIKQQV